MLLGHDKEESTLQMLVRVRLVLEPMCGNDVVEFVLSQPLQSRDSFDGSDEVLNRTNGLKDQDLLRHQTERIVL